MNYTIFGVALAAVFVLSSVTLGVSVFADNSIEFNGDFKGAVRSGNDQSGFFVDTGTYTLFEGVSVAKGHYEITPDDSQCGGQASMEYTITDRNGNSMSFVDEEVSCYMYPNGDRIVSVSEWTVVDGQGKFEGATGTGFSMAVIEMKTFTYYGDMTGEISLGS